MMGPNDYGRLVFLLSIFIAFKGVLDMASSSAFFTFLSQRKRSRKFIRYYLIWVLFQFLISILSICIILPSDLFVKLFNGESKTLVLFGFTAAFMQHHLWNISSQFAESNRETIKVQIISVVFVALHLVVVISLWFWGYLGIFFILIAVTLEWFVASIIIFKICGIRADNDFSNDNPESFKSVFREYWGYCIPFIPYCILSFFNEFADRWMLQYWAGGQEQAYFGIAMQFSGICLLATTSIVRIFWKEVAEANHLRNHESVIEIYQVVSILLYFVGVVFVGAFLPWVEQIVRLLLGDEYLMGVFTITIMLFYPVHQSMGQIGGTVLDSTEKTSLHVRIVLIFMVIGLILSFLIQVPSSVTSIGLGLGSVGLAGKFILVQLAQVNVIAFYICKIYGVEYKFLYQLTALLVTFSVGFITYYMVSKFLFYDTISKFLIYIISYIIFTLTILYKFPVVFGFSEGMFGKIINIASKNK
jgi:O-antigen/teichoic acid export membrane protein